MTVRESVFHWLDYRSNMFWQGRAWATMWSPDALVSEDDMIDILCFTISPPDFQAEKVDGYWQVRWNGNNTLSPDAILMRLKVYGA